METQLGYWRWKLFRWNEHPNPYRNRSDLALTWLNQFQHNASAMAELQQILNTSTTNGYIPTDPRLILEQVAEKMATGEIQVCVEVTGPVALKSVALIIADEVEPDLLRLKSAASPAPAPPPSDPTEESTLGPNNDPVCQAQALKDAAEDGAPFCEECEKAAQKKVKAVAAARQAAAAAPPPIDDTEAIAEVPPSDAAPTAASTDTLSPNTDELAQAQALRDASAKGAFFCEECEKVRKAQEARAAAQAQTVNTNDTN